MVDQERIKKAHLLVRHLTSLASRTPNPTHGPPAVGRHRRGLTPLPLTSQATTHHTTSTDLTPNNSISFDGNNAKVQ